MRFPRLATAAAAVVLVSGCAGPVATPAESSAPPVTQPTETATSTPEPTEEPLVISTAGLGDIKLDSPVPDDQDLISWDATFCYEDTGAWITDGYTKEQPTLLVVRTEDFDETSAVKHILVYDEDIVTPSGVHVGQSFDEAKSLVPEMKELGEPLDDRSVWIVKDDLGQLVFEFVDDKLFDIQATSNDREATGIYYTDGGGICPA